MKKIFQQIALGLTLVCLGVNFSAAEAKTTSHKKSTTTAKKSRHSRGTEKPHSDDYMTGIASCYATKFVGRRTMSGQTFTMDRFTGAHPTLPMGTKLKVTNLKNGQIVYLEINDRMARWTGHVLDLPVRSAEQMGMRCPTLTKVHLEIMDSDAFNGLMRGQLSQALISANPLISESMTLEAANRYAEMMRNESGNLNNESQNIESK
jgi:rare lipoprotein A